MKPLDRNRLIRIASMEDFLTPGLVRKDREELLSLVPFPAVEYRFSPDGAELRARLTVDRFMSLEDYDRSQTTSCGGAGIPLERKRNT